jgi:oligopeptide transport system ATP-binding protein
LIEPNKGEHLQSIKAIEAKFNKMLKKLDDKLSQIKKDLSTRISTLPKPKIEFKASAKTNDDVHKLKVVAELNIKELKAKINDARRINSSKDTLKESQKMQMIFQDPISSLNPRMTVKEIISEGLVIQGNLPKKVIEKKVEDVLNLVGLSPEYASRYPHEFSGGQRQRIGVARALIMDPNVIIADEPISSLDVSIRAQIINLLFALREKLGLTILFIAHDLSVVRFFCDRIAVMYNGRVVEMASSEELFKNPMHPYTISLLSAIPQPDPDYEKNRKRINYNPKQHQYNSSTLPTLKEISPNHLVLASEAEFETMKKSLNQVQKKGGK